MAIPTSIQDKITAARAILSSLHEVKESYVDYFGSAPPERLERILLERTKKETNGLKRLESLAKKDRY